MTKKFIECYGTEIDQIKIEKAICDQQQRFSVERKETFASLLGRLPSSIQLQTRGQGKVVVSEEAVRVGQSGELSKEEERVLVEAIQFLVPWRKGPFELFGQYVDAEWRSDFKWERIKEVLKDKLPGKRVADIGANNGYYMFRALEFNPEFVLGIDPFQRYVETFNFLQHLVGDPRLFFEPLGIQHMGLFPSCFDVVLCMGIVYHQRDPLSALKQLYKSMRKGGLLILESQCIPGDEPIALVPKGRYGKARNVYFVPTAKCLCTWAERAGFEKVEVFSVLKTTPEEQRTTKYSPGESFKDFIDPADSSKTIEGYPAPLRVCVKARRL